MIKKSCLAEKIDSPANLRGFVIPAQTGERMYACLFKPKNDGPRPTILLLHGYPGDENNYDLAHAFQNAGFAVVVFHYRGTWGSEGQFSLTHVLEDVSAAVDFIRAYSGDEKYPFDADNLILIGHSMGGFAALETASRDSGFLGVAAVAAFDFSLPAGMPSLRKAVRREFEDCVPIRRIDLDELMDEIDRNAEHWSFPSLAENLSRLPLCLVAGSKDSIAVPKYHFTPLYRALQKADSTRTTVAKFDDGHCLSGTRTELANLLLDWISKLLENAQMGKKTT